MTHTTATGRTPPRLATLIVLTGLAIMTLNMFMPSLPSIAAEFGVSYGTANLSVVLFLVLTAVLQLIIGPLSDRYGRRPVLLVSMGLFIIGSLGCVLSGSITTFLTFRMVQGTVVAGAVLSRAIVRDTAPPEQAASLLGFIGMIMAIAPITGPILGGVFEQFLGWRATFAFFTLTGLVVLVWCWYDLGETNAAPSDTFAAQFRTYPELFRSRRFWGYALCIAFSVGAFYAFLAGAPLANETHFGLSSAALGAGLGSITCGFMAGNFLTGRLVGRLGLSTMVMIGRLVAFVALSTGLGLWLAGVHHLLVVFIPAIVTGFGNGLTLPSANAGAMSVRPQLAGSASGLSGAMMMLGGAAITWATGVTISGAHAAPGVLTVMLISAACGLAAAIWVWRIDRREGLPGQGGS